MSFVRPPWTSPASVASILRVAPAVEPFTLDEAKLLAGLDWTSPDPRDAMMTGFIAAARAQVEQDTGLALLTQTRDVFITPGHGVIPMPWQANPVQSMTELIVAPYGEPPTLGRMLPPDLCWESDAWAATVAYGGSWRIVAGWPDVATLTIEAPLLRHAVGLLIAHKATLGRDLALETRGAAPGGSWAASFVPMGYAEAIAPYTLVTLV